MRHVYRERIIYTIAGIVLLIVILHPEMNGKGSYKFIEKKYILDSLHKEIVWNFSSSAIADCEYEDVIFGDTTFDASMEMGLSITNLIKEGGEFAPSECKPKFSTAIVVPYRERAEQLRHFLLYIHNFLRHQHIHYRIFVVEQVDTRPFNRAKLLNIGATAAIKAGYPCLVLHDLDLLPMTLANVYACTECVRHMSAMIDKFRFVLPYGRLSGGATAILSKQYKDINGMSNEYFGWGGEDDDFYTRLEEQNLEVCRFEPVTSRYHMVMHREARDLGKSRKDLLKTVQARMKTDGLNSLHYTEVLTFVHPLFTHILADL